jgi:8-oxo-dGTP pyrophosphatase MutT (NUDIX family)
MEFHMTNINPKTLRDSTLVFLVRKEDGAINSICLAMKKRGFGKGRWNGVGGKVEEGESIEGAAKREAKEEICVEIGEMTKKAELSFSFPHNTDFDQKVHVYFAEDFSGEPTETEEMAPSWFGVDAIPYESMWSDDIYWLPQLLKGSFVTGRIVFGEGDVIVEQEMKVR